MSEKYPWFKSYPVYVPHEVDLKKYTSLLDCFDQSIERFRNRPVFQNMDVQITYGELDELANQFCAYLQNNTDLKKGDRIAIQMPNLLQFPVALLGAMKAGLIVVNTNPLYTSEEMKHQFNDSGARAVVILENFASNLEKIVNDTSIDYVITTKIGDLIPGFKGFVVDLVVKYIKKMIPPFNIKGAVNFKKALDKGKGQKFEINEPSREDTAFLQYTGGTTGVSKGAVLSHGNILANVEQGHAWLGSLFKEGEGTIVTALPLYHIFALTVNFIIFFTIGAKNVLITNPRDMKAFMKDLKKNPMEYFTGVNTLFNGMLNQPAFKKVDFSRLVLAAGGGMAVQDVVAKKWYKATGSRLLEGYGLSETSPVVTFNPVNGGERIGSIGLPIPNTHVKLIGEDGNEVPPGAPGEISVKGPQVFKGYWNLPEETKKCFDGDYFLTGDIGTMDEDGYFRIVDRKKEMINVSGFNVYPNEVEKVISEHPKVLEVGVRGVPDEHSSEAVQAYVVKKDDSLTEQEVRDFCREKLTAYKVPKHVVFRDELPKSNVGKILRRLLE
ncbi:AMP-binding protein [bacterium]|nr:AMP-binding protein [bacterium]